MTFEELIVVRMMLEALSEERKLTFSYAIAHNAVQREIRLKELEKLIPKSDVSGNQME